MFSDLPPHRDLDTIAALESIPLAERVWARTPFGLIAASAKRAPDSDAIVFLPEGRADETPERLSYAALLAQVTRAANAFSALGAGPGRPVAYLLPNLPETHVVLWGGTAAGGAAPVNPFLQSGQVAEILEASGACAIVAPSPAFDAELWGRAEAAARTAGVKSLIAVRGPAPDGARSLDRLLADANPDALDRGAPEDVHADAAYFHTGGTTGAPKLARQTQWNEAAMAWMLGYALDLSPEDVVLTGLPLFHANAAILTGIAPLATGSTLLLAGANGFRNRATLDDFWKIVARFGVTVFSGVPTIFASLLDRPIGDADVSSLRYGVVGAAPMPVALFEKFETATGLKILELYGMTESTCVSTCNPRDGERRIGSIGLRLPYHQVKVVELDEDGRHVGDAAPGEPGVLALKGDTVIPGYKQARHNDRLWAGEGWLISGDLARIDEQGYVWLTGRAKDLIIRSGHNIDPQMIEEALHRHPEVELAAAVGKPDAYAGELPVAYVVRKPSARLDADALLEYAADAVAERPAVPKEIHFIDEMPVTAVGKIFKPALREDAARRAVEALIAEHLGKGAATASAARDPAKCLTVTVTPAQGGVDPARRDAFEQALSSLPIHWRFDASGDSPDG